MNYVELVKRLEDSDLVALHNRYCDEMIAPDNEIYTNDSEFLDLFQEGNDAHWLACRVFYGDYNPCHDWVAVNGYGNLVSSDYPSDLMSYSYEELARFLEENPDVIDELGLDGYIEE